MGLAVGSLVHVIVTVLGLSALFAHSPILYTAVKLIGAAYLIYLGLSYWRAQTESSDACVTQAKEKSFFSIFKESIIVEMTNPKTALFFIAFLPQVVVPESGSVAQQLLILGIIVTLSALPCDILVAMASSKVSNWLSRNAHAQQRQARVSGSILLSMGIYILADEVLE